MKWSWKIARIAGIDVYLHATFLILVAWFGMVFWNREGTIEAAVGGMLFIVVLFACVVLHEFGHALTARRYGIVTKHITLLPIGGVAAMEKMPEDPGQEIRVALAGPMVNIVIVGLLVLWLNITGVELTEEAIAAGDVPFAYRLMAVNLFLALFNLLPAFPMDGGRVLRATLALRMPHHDATARAAQIGKYFAIAFGILGLMYNPFLLFIAIFLWLGGEAENQQEQISFSLRKVKAADAMLTEFHILSPHDTLAHAIQLTLAGSQRDFPVGDHHQVQGVLTQTLLLKALQEHGEQARIGELPLANISTVGTTAPVTELLRQVQASDAMMLAVQDASGRIVGIVNMENIVELLKIQSVLKERLRA